MIPMSNKLLRILIVFLIISISYQVYADKLHYRRKKARAEYRNALLMAGTKPVDFNRRWKRIERAQNRLRNIDKLLETESE